MRQDIDVWWFAYEEARTAGADMDEWLDEHPYPTDSAEYAARIRRMILADEASGR